MKEPAYLSLANQIERMIDEGIYKAEEKLPSLRSLHKENGLSIGTILQAFNHLMDKDIIHSREKSGYFVSHRSGKELPLPMPVPMSLSERTCKIDKLLQNLYRDSNKRTFVSFANAIPDNRLLPFNSIKRTIQQISRDSSGSYLMLEDRRGNAALRQEIAKRSFLWQGNVHADDLLITNGALEAMVCCLRAVTHEGDTVLVQDPCYFGIMQALECLNLNVATIPSHPETGIEIEELKTACKELNVKACILVSNFNNPDGACLDSDKKREIAAFANSQQIPVIEDDLYGDLFFEGSRPDTIKAYDNDGWVMYCSSFTKSLLPGFRLGWCIAGKFRYEVGRIKSMYNGSTATFTQRIAGELLSAGIYDRHLKKLRIALQKNLIRTRTLIEQHFPQGTKISRPKGGLVLWVELPEPINTVALQNAVFDHDISYAPGELFSAKGDYQHYLRLSFCNLWEPKTEKALIKLGQLFSVSQTSSKTVSVAGLC